MLDLDSYIDHSVEIKLFGNTYNVLEPTYEMVLKLDAVEEGVTEDNVRRKRLETALYLLNHNKQGKMFSEKELCKLPFEALSRIIVEVCTMRYEAQENPN